MSVTPTSKRLKAEEQTAKSLLATHQCAAIWDRDWEGGGRGYKWSTVNPRIILPVYFKHKARQVATHGKMEGSVSLRQRRQCLRWRVKHNVLGVSVPQTHKVGFPFRLVLRRSMCVVDKVVCGAFEKNSNWFSFA